MRSVSVFTPAASFLSASASDNSTAVPPALFAATILNITKRLFNGHTTSSVQTPLSGKSVMYRFLPPAMFR